VRGAKAALNAVGDQLLGRAAPDIAEQMSELVAEAYGSEDLREGLTAMSEKRPPNFKGSHP
jgi:1,4-dihydroxy-2-naphthoyl-CoA synthase